MNTCFYDSAAQIIIKLNKFGDSTVKAHFNENFDRYTKLIHEEANHEKQLYSCYNQVAQFINKTDTKRVSKELGVYISYLILLDYLSASIETFAIDMSASNAPLNRNYIDEVEIYPTFPGINRNGNAYDIIFCVFKNLIFFHKTTKLYKTLKLKNYYLAPMQGDFKIGFIPYPYSEEEIFELHGDKVIGKERLVLSKEDNVYLNACKKLSDDCDLIFGPEMHGSALLDAELKNIFKNSNCNVLISPSYHYSVGDSIKNSSTVYIRQSGHNKTEKADKCFKAKVKKNVEGLTHDAYNVDHSIVLMHVKGVGRVLLLICKDFLCNEFLQFVEHLNIDIVIVQCYTESLFEFQSKADSVMRKRLIIIGNSCRASKEIIFADGVIHPLVCYGYNYSHYKRGPTCSVNEEKCQKECKFNYKTCCRIISVKTDIIEDDRIEFVFDNVI